MSGWALLAKCLLTTATVLAFFMLSFVAFQDQSDNAVAGICFGILSAVAWGFGSIGGPAGFSNKANFFAAVFAVMTLGFVAPAEACRNSFWLALEACRFQAWVHGVR